MSTDSPWATLTLSTKAHEALSIPEAREIGNTLVDLKARIGIAGSADRGWDIQVSSWRKDRDSAPIHAYRVNDQQGHLADLIHAAMDEYQRRFAFTSDELVTVAAQSGMEIRRA